MDSLDQVTEYLFRRLVDIATLEAVLGEEEPEEVKSSLTLANEVGAKFAESGLFSDGAKARIYRNRDYFGKTRPWRFQFVQHNGVVVPIEVFDFSKHPRTVERHVGWAKAAFSDVSETDVKQVSCYSVVLPSAEPTKRDSDWIGLLEQKSKIVDWSSRSAMKQFIDERLEVAYGNWNTL